MNDFVINVVAARMESAAVFGWFLLAVVIRDLVPALRLWSSSSSARTLTS
jgi:hypothetical protein